MQGEKGSNHTPVNHGIRHSHCQLPWRDCEIWKVGLPWEEGTPAHSLNVVFLDLDTKEATSRVFLNSGGNTVLKRGGRQGLEKELLVIKQDNVLWLSKEVASDGLAEWAYNQRGKQQKSRAL